MPESFQLERIFVKLFLRNVCVYFGQKYQTYSQEIKKYKLMMSKILRIEFRTYVRYWSTEKRRHDFSFDQVVILRENFSRVDVEQEVKWLWYFTARKYF